MRAVPRPWEVWGVWLIVSVLVVVGLAHVGMDVGGAIGAFVRDSVHVLGTRLLP